MLFYNTSGHVLPRDVPGTGKIPLSSTILLEIGETGVKTT